jgi:endoglucanase
MDKYTPTWGTNDTLTDWHRAATIGGNTVLSNNPNLLIIVEGLNYATDLTKLTAPLVSLSVPNKLVYSGHVYSWTWGVDWNTFTYDQYKTRMNATQTFVRSKGIPFWLGEFGTNTQDKYWNFTIQYLKEFSLDWAYWALNGYQGTPDKDETFGILKHDWFDLRYPWMLADLVTI